MYGRQSPSRSRTIFSSPYFIGFFSVILYPLQPSMVPSLGLDWGNNSNVICIALRFWKFCLQKDSFCKVFVKLPSNLLLQYSSSILLPAIWQYFQVKWTLVHSSYSWLNLPSWDWATWTYKTKEWHQGSKLRWIPNLRCTKVNEKIYDIPLNIMVVVDVCIFADKPDEYFDIFFAPVFFDSFVFDHSK